MSDLTGTKLLRIEYIPLPQVTRWDRNPKIHDLDSLASSIRRYGFRDAPIYDATLGALVAGNGRSLAIQRIKDAGESPPDGVALDEHGDWMIPVQFGNDAASVAVAEAFAIDHNNLTISGAPGVDIAAIWDSEAYAGVLSALRDGAELPETVSGDEVERLLGSGNGAGVDAEPQIDRADELRVKWGTALGQVWALGPHRLVCGDCTDRAVVKAAIYGEKASLYLPDPPYGVKRDKGFKGFGGFGPPIARRQYNDEWDSERPNKATFDLHLNCSNRAIIFGGNYFADVLPRSSHWIVWDKLNTMPTYGDCELLWTNLDRKSVKKLVFEYNGLIGKEKDRYHPTQKPVGLYDMILEEYSQDGEVVADFYLGSGTTLIAAHNLSRICRAIEIDPGYVAVTLQRFHDATGITPQRVSDGL